MEEDQKEVARVSGVVEAVSQHDERRFSIKVGGEWYSGFGSCPAVRGSVYVVEYAVNGRFRNIKRIREVGEAFPGTFAEEGVRPQETRVEALLSVPIAVKNYVTTSGWQQTAVTAEDEELIQREVRKRNYQIASESFEDARRLLAQSGVSNAVTPRNVLELALHLSERRMVHISKIYEEFLKAKIAAERRSIGPDPVELASDEEAGA